MVKMYFILIKFNRYKNIYFVLGILDKFRLLFLLIFPLFYFIYKKKTHFNYLVAYIYRVIVGNSKMTLKLKLGSLLSNSSYALN